MATLGLSPLLECRKVYLQLRSAQKQWTPSILPFWSAGAFLKCDKRCYGRAQGRPANENKVLLVLVGYHACLKHYQGSCVQPQASDHFGMLAGTADSGDVL